MLVLTLLNVISYHIKLAAACQAAARLGGILCREQTFLKPRGSLIRATAFKRPLFSYKCR